MVFNFGEMGHNASLPKGRRKSLRSFLRKSTHRRNLSHTFTVPEMDNTRMELLNINVATEEELMTLPTVTREIARNIVEHRKAIGRYRKVEDLALVRGIGAHKLELLRPEICVSSRRNQSCASSRAPSYDSLKSTDSRTTNRSVRLININKASVFDLQSVPGITQEIAAGIVIQRNKKGAFKKIEDLLKVKCINRMRLDHISRHLTVEDEEGDTGEQTLPRPSILTNGLSHPTRVLNGHIHRPSFVGHVPNGLPLSSLIDIFELLSTYSPRPVIADNFKAIRNGQSVVRVCSWNLQDFSMEKANNLGVKEVVCRTILENSISLVAVQDITNVVALKTICEELNKPSLRRIEEWKDNSHSWNFCTLDVPHAKLGFIYDAAGAADIELVSLMDNPEDTKDDCEALIAHFMVGDLNLQVVNMSIKKDANLELLNDKIKDLISEEELVMVCIDFASCTSVEDKSLCIGGLSPVFPGTTNTHFPSLKTTNHSSHKSNILTNSLLKNNMTGYKNVISRGLTHLGIPNGWSWGGPVSPFCPVWVELFLKHQSEGTAL